jgi:uncharacterized protein involved in exopolysaccharide biosynthesis
MRIKWLHLSIRKIEDEVLERGAWLDDIRRTEAAHEREIKRLTDERNALHREVNEVRIRLSNVLASLPTLELMERNRWR